MRPPAPRATPRCPTDPIAQLVHDLECDGQPSLEWVVRWSEWGGESVAAAWAHSRAWDPMLSVLARVDRLTPQVLIRATEHVALDARAIAPAVPHGLGAVLHNVESVLAGLAGARVLASRGELGAALAEVSATCGRSRDVLEERVTRALARALRRVVPVPPTLGELLAH